MLACQNWSLAHSFYKYIKVWPDDSATWNIDCTGPRDMRLWGKLQNVVLVGFLDASAYDNHCHDSRVNTECDAEDTGLLSFFIYVFYSSSIVW